MGGTGGRRATIGGQELELLRWIEARQSVTAAEAAAGFGAERGLARSTVLTMLERLRGKGHLRRRSVAGVFRYRAAVGAGEAVRRAVAEFVERTLSGSVAPMVDYLVERERLAPEERAELERWIERLGGRRDGSET
jgi:predicted transcriptional regulator